jgi:hypothetical protein
MFKRTSWKFCVEFVDYRSRLNPVQMAAFRQNGESLWYAVNLDILQKTVTVKWDPRG